jgi:hypothetical protein
VGHYLETLLADTLRVAPQTGAAKPGQMEIVEDVCQAARPSLPASFPSTPGMP